MALKNYQSFPLLEEYLNYLTVIKGRSMNTVIEYRTDILMFLQFMNEKRRIDIRKYDLSNVDVDYLRSIELNDMYSFISYCQNDKNSSAGTRSKKYLRNKAHVLEQNIAEELETPKIPKRIPKYLTLEEAIRLLIECENSKRDHCIITMFLNCALRLSELTSIDVHLVTGDTLNIIGKGNKERRIFYRKSLSPVTPATKKAINEWLEERKNLNPSTNALFVTKNQTRITNRAVQDLVKKYIKKAGLEHRNISTHKLRHTAATLMYQYGNADLRSLQEILGHTSVATTEIYYVKIFIM